jgi:hypothetical protein
VDAVADGGGSAECPVLEVMGVGRGDGAVAEPHDAPIAVAGNRRLALRPGEEPLLLPDHLGRTVVVDGHVADTGGTS